MRKEGEKKKHQRQAMSFMSPHATPTRTEHCKDSHDKMKGSFLSIEGVVLTTKKIWAPSMHWRVHLSSK